MSDTNVRYVLTVDGASGSVTAVEKLSGALKESGHASESMTGSFFKAEVAMEALRKGMDFVVSAFEDGIKAEFENEAAISRASVAAANAGIHYQQLADAAESIQNPLVEGTQKLSMMTDLVNKGFDLSQAHGLMDALGNIAATGKDAGVSVQQGMGMMVDAITKGRVSGIELAHMLPQLRGAMKDAGVSMTDLAGGAKQARAEQTLLNEIMRQGAADAGGLAEYMKKPQGAMEAFTVAANESKEALGRGFVTGIQPLFGALNEVMGTAGFGGVQDIMEIVGQTVGGTLVSAFKLGAAGVLVLANSGTLLGFIWKGVRTDMLDSVQSILQGLSEIAKLTPGASDDYAKLVAAQSTVNAALRASQKDFDQSGEGVVKLTNTIKDLISNAFKPMPPAVAQVKDALDAHNKSQNDNAAGAAKLQKALEAQAKAWEGMKGDVIASISAIDPVFSAFVALVDAGSANVGQDALDMAASEKQLADAIGGSVADQVSHLKSNFDLLRPSMTGTIYNTDGLDKALKKIAADGPPAFKGIFDAVVGLSDRMRSLAEETMKVGNTIAGMFGQLSSIGGTLGSIFGAISSAAQSFTQTFAQVMEKTGSTVAAYAGAIGAAMGQVGQAIGGKAGGALSTIGNFTATGAMFGPWGAAVGAAVGVAVAAFNLMKKDWTADTSSMIDNMMGLGKVSDELAKKIGDLAKKIGDENTAIVLSLGQIADEQGITTSNWQSFYDQTLSVFRLLQEGFVNQEQAIGVLNEMFPKLVAAAGGYNKALLDMIQETKDFGLSVDSINQYLLDNANKAVAALNTIFDEFEKHFSDMFDKIKQGLIDIGKTVSVGGGETSTGNPLANQKDIGAAKGQLGQMQNYLIATFNAMVQAGTPMDQILAQLGPDFEKLAGYMKQMGMTGNAAFQQLLKDERELAKEKGIFTHLNNIVNMNEAIFASGQGNAQMFHNLEHNIDRTIVKMGGFGHISNAELASMVPSLQEVIREHELLGIPIDANTQRLIDLAKKQGLLDDTSGPDALTKAMDGLGKIVDEKLTPAIDALTKALLGVPSNIPINFQYTTSGTLPPTGGPGPGYGPDPGGGTRPGGRHHDLRGALEVTAAEYTATLKKGEMILGTDASRNFTGGGGGGRVVNNHFAPHPGMSPSEYEAMIKRIVREMEEHGEAPFGRSQRW